MPKRPFNNRRGKWNKKRHRKPEPVKRVVVSEAEIQRRVEQAFEHPVIRRVYFEQYEYDRVIAVAIFEFKEFIEENRNTLRRIEFELQQELKPTKFCLSFSW